MSATLSTATALGLRGPCLATAPTVPGWIGRYEDLIRFVAE